MSISLSNSHYSLTKSLIYIDIKRVDRISSHLIILRITKAQRLRQVPKITDNVVAAQGPESRDHDTVQCFVQYAVLTPNYYILQKYC